MKIVTRIYLFCLALVCVFCLIFVFSVYQQKKIIGEIEHIIERDVEITENLAGLTIYQLELSILLERIARHTLEQRISAKKSDMLALGIGLKNEYLNKFHSLLIRIQKNINIVIEHAYDRKSEEEFVLLKKKINKIKDLHHNYIAVSNSMLSQVETGKIEDFELYETAFITLEDELNYVFESTLFEVQSFTAESVKEIRRRERVIYKIYLFSGGFLLLLICVFLVLIILRIRHSIQQAVQFAENIEAGNRQPPGIVPGKDEIGKIIHAMEFMLQAITKAEDELKRIALTDSLTGIANRLRFNKTLENEVERAKRYKQAFSLIMFDIDHFKNFNDIYGHDAGDAVLVELSALVVENIRNTDLLARWGGEEFMLLTSSTTVDEAAALAEKLQEKIENHHFSENRQVTCSFGLADYLGEGVDSFLKRVDSALYKSKRSGRNMITIADTPQQE